MSESDSVCFHVEAPCRRSVGEGFQALSIVAENMVHLASLASKCQITHERS